MKKIIRILMLSLVALTLSGCFKYRMNLNVKSDGSVSGTRQILFHESVLSMVDSDPDKALQLIIDSRKESDSDADFKKIIEESGETVYRGFEMPDIPTGSYEVTRESNQLRAVVKLWETRMQLNDAMDNTSDQETTWAQWKAYGAEATVTVTMPQDIESANIGVVDGRSVTIDLFEDYGTVTQLEVISKATSMIDSLRYAALGLAAILVVIVVIRMRKDKEKTEPTQDLDADSQSSESQY